MQSVDQNGTGFVYDANGNPTTYNGASCTFDVFNRATSLGTALTAGYRSDGMRAWKQDSAGNRTYYLYDGSSPVQEMDASGNYKAEFVYGPAGLISHNRASLGTVFFAYDALGSVQSVFGNTGSLISTRVYDAYGQQASGGIVADATHDDPEIGYNGQSGYITDPETNLVLCGHRYYDPSAGRWLNRDPIGYAGGIGLYNYCANNPVMGVDTSGLAVVSAGPGFTAICLVGVTCDYTINLDTCNGDIGLGIDGGGIIGPGFGFSFGPGFGVTSGGISTDTSPTTGVGGLAGVGMGYSGAVTAPIVTGPGGSNNVDVSSSSASGGAKYGPTVGYGVYQYRGGSASINLTQIARDAGGAISGGLNNIYGNDNSDYENEL